MKLLIPMLLLLMISCNKDKERPRKQDPAEFLKKAEKKSQEIEFKGKKIA
jgi:hypothetical protein